MSLADMMESQFRADVRFRGAAYWQAGRVHITHVTPDDIYAVVRDGAEHQIHIHRTETELELHCSSVAGTKRPSTTKYVWALILAIDGMGYLAGTPKPGRIPPFVSETESQFEEDWDADLEDEAYFPPIDFTRKTSKGSAGTATQEKPRVQKSPEWMLRLRQIRDRLRSREASNETKPHAYEISYQVDVAESWSCGHIMLQILECQRRASGGWGKVKPLRLKTGGLEMLPEADDRAILSHLLGGIQDRSGNGTPAPTSAHQHVPHRFRLTHSLAEILLPRMCSTGRLRLAFEDGRISEPLQWGAETPWELTLSISRQGETESRQRESVASVGSRSRSIEENAADPDLDADLDADFTPDTDAELEAEFSDAAELGEDSAASTENAPGDESRSSWEIRPFLARDTKILPIHEADLLVEGGFVFIRDTVEPLEDFEVFEWVRAARGNLLPAFEDADGPGVVHELMTLPTVPRLELPERWQLEEKHVTPQPRLKLFTPSMKGAMPRDRIQADVEFAYDQILVRGSTHSWALPLPDEKSCLVRDTRLEQTYWGQLQGLGIPRIDDRGGNRHDVQVPLNQLSHILQDLFSTGWEVLSDEKPFRQPGEVAFRVESGIDWFDVRGEVQYGATSVSVPVLLSALARGDRTVQLEDGSLGYVPEEWKERFGVLLSLAEADGDGLRFSSSQAALVDALLQTQPNVDYDDKFLVWRKKLAEFSGVRSSIEPESFRGELRDYQREGLGWLKFLEEFQFGGCLADDMGLGKTVQILAFLAQRYEQKKEHDPTLIVVPKSLLFNWQKEIQRFTPHLSALEYSGISRSSTRSTFHRHDIILMTYATLRRDIVALKDFSFDCVILDEAQAIKNPSSQVAKATRLLKGSLRLALSGTPIENHLGDMWSIFEFLNPGLLGRSSVFKALSNETDADRLTQAIAGGLKPFVLRRTKEKVAADLPDRLEETLYCDLSPGEMKLYNEMRDYYRNSIFSMVDEQGMGRAKMHVLEALLRLRQAACHPALLDRGRIEEPSTKLEVLVEHLQELREEGHKTLVFSQFTSLLAIVKNHLDRNNIPFTYLDGSTKDRDVVVETFQNDPNIPVFLISLKAGGLGLNLTAADYVFLLDPWWNPAVEAQAIDRAHRVGQTRNVIAYRLIARGTIEEKIAELQSNKRKLADAILSENSRMLKNLTQEDLQLLFS